METEEWSLDQCKDFLHRSWFSRFPQKYADYFPFGNTEATDFLLDLDFQSSELNVLMIGAGDIRSILRTVSGLENKEHSKQRVKKLHILLNDIDGDIVARDILLLHIIHTMDVKQEEDFHFLWNVWYNLELPEEHHKRLLSIISRLNDGNVGENSVWSFTNKSTEEAVAKSFHQWQQCSVTVDQAEQSRMEAMDQIKLDSTDLLLPDLESVPLDIRPTNHTVLVGLLGAKEVLNIETYWPIEEHSRRHAAIMLMRYYESGSADPYFGNAGKQWPDDRPGWKVNPTLLKANTTEYLVDVTTSPFTSYTPLQKEFFEEHPHLADACFNILKERVRTYRMLVDSRKLEIHIEMCCEDAAVLLTSDALGDKKFDVIDTSSLADDMSLLALLLLCQPKLRGKCSVLRVESILWRHDHDTIEEYIQHELMGLDPLLFPTVLGLRLAESFQYGRRKMPTGAEARNGSRSIFCLRDTLMWMKTACDDASPITIEEDSMLHTYLVGLSRRVLTDTTSRLQNPFVLFKLLLRLAPTVVGGMDRLLQLVEPMVTGESELMFQWQVYRAVYGYADAPDPLILVEASVIKEALIFKLLKPSFLTCDVGDSTPQRFQNVLISTNANNSRRVAVLMLGSHKNNIKHLLPISLTNDKGDQGQIVVKNNITTICHTTIPSSDREIHSRQPAKELCIIREITDKYIVSLQKGLLVNKAGCKINHNTLTIITTRSTKKVLVSFVCSIHGVSITTQDEVCHVTVTKKKDEISGEHILPLCRIQLNKLKPLADFLHNSVNRKNVAQVMYPLVSDIKLRDFIIDEPVKSMNVGGEDILVYLRVLLWSIINLDGLFLDINDGSLDLELKDVCWCNQTILRKVDVIDMILPGTSIRSMPHVNKETVQLLVDLLHNNAQRLDQSGTAPGRYRSFLQVHYPRGNVLAQQDKEQLKLQGQETDPDVCASCRKKGSRKQCAACLSVKYCSRECQKLHYRRHKLVCKHLAASKPAAVPKPSLCPHCKTKEASSAHVCSRCKKTEYCSMKCRYAHWPEHQQNCQDLEDERQKDPSKDEVAPTSKSDTTLSASTTQSTTASTLKPSAIQMSNRSIPGPSSTQNQSPLPTRPSSSNALPVNDPPPTNCTSCAWCDKPVDGESMRECSKCHESVYCSERCEHAHWPQHWQKCIELSLANVAGCAACKHTLTRCHRCKQVWFCSGCLDHMKEHKC